MQPEKVSDANRQCEIVSGHQTTLLTNLNSCVTEPVNKASPGSLEKQRTIELCADSTHEMKTDCDINSDDAVQDTDDDIPECQTDYNVCTRRLYSVKGDMIEDVIEAIQDNSVPVKTYPVANDNRKLKTRSEKDTKLTTNEMLKATYDASTGEYLVRIGKFPYPVDIHPDTMDECELSESNETANYYGTDDVESPETSRSSSSPECDYYWHANEETMYLERSDISQDKLLEHEQDSPTLLTNLDTFMVKREYPESHRNMCTSDAGFNLKHTNEETKLYQWPSITNDPDLSKSLDHQLPEIWRINHNILEEDIRNISTEVSPTSSAFRNDAQIQTQDSTSLDLGSFCQHSPSLPVNIKGLSVCLHYENWQTEQYDHKSRSCSECSYDDDVFVHTMDTTGLNESYTQRDEHSPKQSTADASLRSNPVEHNCRGKGAKRTGQNIHQEKRPKKGPNQKLKRSCRLWEFIRNLLLDPSTNPTIIRWEDRDTGTFRLVQSKAIARIWGDKKGNGGMNYEKLSRAMRYYYKRQIFAPVLGRRLVYSFGPRATGWRADDVE